MLYDEYKYRMMKLAMRIAFFKKHRLKFILLFSAVFAVTAALLALKGTVLSYTYPSQLVYGETGGFYAKAFLSKNGFEFQGTDGIWIDAKPKMPGQYTVRCYGKDLFGNKRYSQEWYLTILKKDLEVTMQSTAVYGENPAIVANTAYNDRVLCEDFIFEDKTATKTLVQIHPDALQIVDENGESVLSAYNVTTKEQTVSILPRDLSLTIADATKEYDGVALASGSFSQKNLAKDDLLFITFAASITDAGCIENTPSDIFILNSEKKDVTHLYNISTKTGYLTVTPRDITVMTDSISATYDGTNHSAPSFWLSEQSDLIGNDYLERLSSTHALDAGTYENSMTFRIWNEKGENKTQNYHVTLEMGTITVLPRSITVTTPNKTWVYDDSVHQTDSVSADNLAIGDHCEILSAQTILDAGTMENVKTVAIWNTERNVTKNYEIAYVYGTLTVEKRSITLRPQEVHAVYDGQEHYATAAELCEDSEYEIIDGHTAIITATAAQNAGRFASYLQSTAILRGNTDVTSNYEIHTKEGWITIDPRPIHVRMLDREREYDDLPFTSTAHEITAVSPHEFALVTGHKLIEALASGSIIEPGIADNTLTGYRIVDREGKDMTANYTVSSTPGTLTVLPRKITVVSFSAQKIYDGLALTCKKPLGIYSGSLVSSHSLDMAANGKITEIGKTENKFSGTVRNGAGKDIGYCYEITPVYGELRILPAPSYHKNTDSIEITPVYQWKLYDGEALYAKHLVAGNPTFCDLLTQGYTYTVTVGGCAIDPGTQESVIENFSLFDPSGSDVTDQFNIILHSGVLEVLDYNTEVIHVYSYMIQKYYSNTPLTFLSDDFEILRIGNGLTMDISPRISIAEAMQYLTLNDLNTTAYFYTPYTVLCGWQDVSQRCRVIFEVPDNDPRAYLTAKVDKRAIELTAKSASKYYDADEEPLVCDGYDITLGTLLEGHSIGEIEYLGSIAEIGTTNCSIGNLKIFDKNGIDVTENYEITKLDGVLEILKNPEKQEK